MWIISGNLPSVCGRCSTRCWISSVWTTARSNPTFPLAGFPQSRIFLNGVHAHCHEQGADFDSGEPHRCGGFDRQGTYPAIGNNLLSNAIKFTDNGSVSLAADYDNGLLKLIVEDTGTGMTEDEQQRVFGAFERLSNAAAKDGFGLGLSIVQRIVAMLGGTIHLESEKGKGSRFTVEIPMQTAEELPEQTIQAQMRHNHICHDVIAIDNDEVLLLMLKEMYAHEGMHCDTCTNVSVLMELIRKRNTACF